MLSYQTNDSCRLLLTEPLTSNIQHILDESTAKLNQQTTLRPVTATFTTFDRCKMKIDLNICRPTVSAGVQQVVKKTVEERNNLEDLIIIWLDEKIHQDEEKLAERTVRVREIVNCFKTFDNSNQCFSFIRTIKEEKILLIMSGLLGKNFINEVHDISQLLSAYVFCFDDYHHKRWAKNHRKIVGTYTNENELMKQVARDVSSFYQHHIPISIIHSIETNETSAENFNEELVNFFWPQLFMNILFQLPQTAYSKYEFLQECRRQYIQNSIQQKKLIEYELNYNSSNATQWYSYDNFLYRITNKAIRTQNVQYLFKCRFFINDLYQNLKSHQSKCIKTCSTNKIAVFRGQMIATSEFAKLKKNINGFVSINTFLSATYSSTIATNSAGRGSGRPMFESVLFEFDIDVNRHKTPFADIDGKSSAASEKELLLSIGTIFRIESVKQASDTLWHVKLVTISEEESTRIDDFIRSLKQNIVNGSNYLLFGKLLQDTGRLDQVEKFYEILLTELPVTHRDVAAIYAGLGYAASKTHKNLRRALVCLRQSLVLQIKAFPENFILLVETLMNIASIYIEQQNYQSALNYCKLILTILDYASPKNHSRILARRALVYSQMGSIFYKTDLMPLAMKYYKMAQKIERKLTPVNQYNIAAILKNIAAIYLKKRNFPLAEKYLLEAKAMHQASLSIEHHSDHIQMYDNLGKTEYERKNFNQALHYFQKALEVQLKCMPRIHPQTVMLYNSLGNAYFSKGDIQKALEMYEKALEIGQQCPSSTHLEISLTYTNMGSACRSSKDFARALTLCERAVNFAERSLPPSHPDLGVAYRNLAQVHNHTKNPSDALANFLKALDIYNKTLPKSSFQLGTLYEEVGTTYYNIGRYEEASNNLEQALSIYQSSEDSDSARDDDSSLTALLFNLGQAYYKSDDFRHALVYSEKHLHYELASAPNVNYIRLSETYHVLGDIYRQRTDYSVALKHYEKALESVHKDNSLTTTANDKSTLIRQYQSSIESIRNRNE